MNYRFSVFQTERSRYFRGGNPLIINTDVSIENNTMLVNCSKINGNNYNRKYGSYNWGYRKISLSDIDSIQTKNGYLYGFREIFTFLIVIISWICTVLSNSLIIGGILEKYIFNTDLYIHFSGIPLVFIPISIILTLGWISSFTFRSLKINIKDGPSIIFPYRKFWSTQKGSINSKYEDLENIKEFGKLIDELKNNNIKIKITKPKIDVNFLKVCLILSCVTIFISFLPLDKIDEYFSFKKKEREQENIKQQENIVKNNLISAIQNDECYVSAEFKKGKLIDRKNEQNIYKIIETNEELQIKEHRSTEGGIYKIAIFKYYSKSTNEIIVTEYYTDMIADPKNEYNDWMIVTKYNVQYRYNFSTKKLICFNIPNVDLSQSYIKKTFKVGLYYKNKKNYNYWWISEISNLDEIYEFQSSDQEEEKDATKNYTYLKKIGTYTSKYGKSTIIKANKKSVENDMYIMYIQNNQITSQNDFNGIVLSCINGDEVILDENTATNYFKTIVPQV